MCKNRAMTTTSDTLPPTSAIQQHGWLLTKAEAASYLGIKPRTLDDWRSQKAITCIERGAKGTGKRQQGSRYVRFLRSDLDAFIQSHRIPAKALPTASQAGVGPV